MLAINAILLSWKTCKYCMKAMNFATEKSAENGQNRACRNCFLFLFFLLVNFRGWGCRLGLMTVVVLRVALPFIASNKFVLNFRCEVGVMVAFVGFPTRSNPTECAKSPTP